VTRELHEILAGIEKLDLGTAAVLATVIDVRGSSYRLPGAKMLVLGSGETVGTISGGCLEADVLERTKKVLRSSKPEVFTYDTTSDENSVFSLNMGCRGVVRILLERVDKDNALLTTIRNVQERRQRQVVATLVSATPSDQTEIGGRVFCDSNGRVTFEDLPSSLANLAELTNDCKLAVSTGGDLQMRSYELGQQVFEFFFEIVKPPVLLLIFGAGADSIPLADLVERLGWQASVIDHRPAFLTEKRFPHARDLVRNDPDQVSIPFAPDDQTAAVVMTHNYTRDREILSLLLGSGVFYIGVLGPKRRTEQLLAELTDRGEHFDEDQLSKLYAPVGLDIGGDTPESIALSIAAEIQSVLKTRDGGNLRDRQGSIYGRER
jgi:xanthine dehydrogenase accessory factor